MKLKKSKFVSIALIAVSLYLLFFPSFTPEMAVRKDLFLSFHPVKAIVGDVQAGIIKNDPRYGDLYIVDGIDRPFIYVKKNSLGWHVASSGSGP